MTTPVPQQTPRDGVVDGFVEQHRTLDERLDEAFRRYDQAFRERDDKLVEARMNLSLLLWEGDDPPEAVTRQLRVDAEQLLRDTPPLPEVVPES